LLQARCFMPLELSTENEGRILAVTVIGKLTKEDYDRFVPEVDRLVKQFGKIDLLFHMRDFHGWRAAALWEDTKFAVRHFHDIDRLAVVGEKAWQKGMTVFCKPFTKAEVRYFNQDEFEKAGEWLREEHAVGKKS
jgi:hypothetical protein